ncbi:MAG: hypothetical protein ACKOYN_08875 [Planctomycetota bacterium]
MKLETFARSLATLALSLAMALPAFAADVKLSNGSIWKGDVGAKVRATFMQAGKETVIEGTVVKAESGLVVIETTEGGRTAKRTILSLDLRKLETLTAAAAPGTAPAVARTAAQASGDSAGSKEASSTMPHIFVLPMSGMVGTGMRHNEIEAVAKEADKYGPGQIIVLLIDSGGGLVIEGDKIHATMKEVKKRHRVVAWIKRAISAAAFTALHCDEIYFMRVGALGSITMFSGTTAISGPELDAWLEKVGEASRIGGREPIVGQAMVTNPIECSYDRDEDGNITWYKTMQGEFDLSDSKENLTLNADNALHCKFSDGTADTVEELATLLQLKQWKEESGTGRKISENWNRLLAQCVEQKQRLYNDYQNPGGLDNSAVLGNRIKTLTEIIKWYEKCYPGMVYEQPNFPPSDTEGEAPEEMKRELARLKKDLGDMKKRGR